MDNQDDKSVSSGASAMTGRESPAGDDPGRDLQSARDDLTHTDVQVRLRALEYLGDVKAAAAVEPITALLKDGNKSVHEAAARALARIGEPAIPFLIQAMQMKVGGYYGRFAAHDSLVEIGSPAQPALLDIVRGEYSIELRANALGVLAAIRDISNIPLFFEILSGLNPGLHDKAAAGLSNLGVAALPALEQALDHESATVRRSAIMALGRLRAAHVATWLVACLSDPDTMRGAAWALFMIGGDAVEAADKILISILQTGSAEMRLIAIEALGDKVFRQYHQNADGPRLLMEIIRNPSEDIRLRGSALYNVSETDAKAHLLPIFHQILEERPESVLIPQVLEMLQDGQGGGGYDEPTITRLVALASEPSSKYNQDARQMLLFLAHHYSPDEPLSPSLVTETIRVARHEAAHMRALAVLGLAGLRTSDAIPVLVERLNDNAEYKLNVGMDEQPVYETVTISQLAARALERTGMPEALAALETWRMEHP